jgi:hypothetical protein
MVSREKLTSKVQQILDDRFTGDRAKVRAFHDRLNFACPYCGDSSDDSRKKRANIYWKNYSFHCFNGGCPNPSSTLLKFFADHGQRIGDIGDIDEISSVIHEARNSAKRSSSIEFNQFIELERWAVPMQEIDRALGLTSVDGSAFAAEYLRSRKISGHREMLRFGKRDRCIYIFNLTADHSSAIGYQIAKLGGPSKYLSFNLERLNFEVGRKVELDPETLARTNTLSLFFGLLQCDFSRPVTIFEGVFDSLFMENSIAAAGLKRDLSLFSGNNSRFMLDNDQSGFTVAKDLLKSRQSVFMWKKVLRECGMDTSIKDLNQFVIESHGSTAQKDPGQYFTRDPLDLIYV